MTAVFADYGPLGMIRSKRFFAGAIYVALHQLGWKGVKEFVLEILVERRHDRHGQADWDSDWRFELHLPMKWG